VQLKSSFIGSKVRHISVGTKLLAKPGGCVIWLEFDADSLRIERYLWLGGDPGHALPDIGSRLARHSKSNSFGQKTERPMHRQVLKTRFQTITSIDQLKNRLFAG
jgi:hypothetical protein